ncbi:CaiB/BaiF CoA transferase family protein [Achromobacter aegrifaciens]
MNGPLKGLKVIDLTSVIMGPTASQFLGDHGADVVKVEAPEGDVMRLSGPMVSPGMGHYFLTANRSKRSIVIDLKAAAGRDVLLEMTRQADVFMYNIRPEAMARLGLGYDDVRRVAPNIIYAGALGFSQRGPYAGRPAYDDLMQSMSGIAWLAGQASGDRPLYAPFTLADRMMGLQFLSTILAAVVHRERTGEGQRVDIPMFEGMAAIMLGEHMAGQMFRPQRGETGYKRSIARDRRPFKTSDGFISVLVYTDDHWQRFLRMVGYPHLLDDDRFSSMEMRRRNVTYVYGWLAEVMLTRSTEEWLTALHAIDVPATPTYSIDQLMQDRAPARDRIFQGSRSSHGRTHHGCRHPRGVVQHSSAGATICATSRRRYIGNPPGIRLQRGMYRRIVVRRCSPRALRRMHLMLRSRVELTRRLFPVIGTAVSYLNSFAG